MSNLVVKNMNETGDPQNPILYKDARVNDGTLFCLDFSNRGMLVNYDLTKGITDLADTVQAREDGGIITENQISVSTAGTIPELTDKKGMPMTFLGNIDQQMYTTGILIDGIGQYLYNTQPSALFIVWLMIRSDVANRVGGRIIRSGATPSTGTQPYNFWVHHPSQGASYGISLGLATKSGFANYQLSPDTPTQLAIERTSGSGADRLYVNGNYIGLGNESVGDFGVPTNDGVAAIGGNTTNPNVRQPSDLYHVSLHDLSVSGIDAADWVARDYEYVNGIGRYDGLPTRRPYANVAV